MKQFCHKANIDLEQLIPTTFILNLDFEHFDPQLKDFIKLFLTI